MKKPAPVILIAGPTASGKSAAAIALARETGGWVVNADSMQVYDCWRVLSARPAPEEEALVPHRLYGHRRADQWYSVGDWLRELAALRACADAPLIVTGGTGLYFRAATQGLAAIPAIPHGVRAAAEDRLAQEGADAFRAALLALDPSAAALDIDNPRRMLRAWEVKTATGRSITEWAQETPAPILPDADIAFRGVLSPPRELLAARISARFDVMMGSGALEEVAAVRALALDPDLPAMRAIGYRQLSDYLDGAMTRAQAIERAVIETRQYAKRQRTWFRNQLGDWPQFESGKLLLAAARDALGR